MGEAPEQVFVAFPHVAGAGLAFRSCADSRTPYIRLEALSDPNAVHVNMLRGTIAKPSWAQITHIYAEEYAAAIASARAQAIEEERERCAKVLDKRADDLARQIERMRGYRPESCDAEDSMAMREARHAAAAIRALSARPDTTGPVIEAAKAVNDVLAERRRQIEAEGWTPEHDDQHQGGELARAAATYAMVASAGVVDRGDNVPTTWPWAREWWKPSDTRRDLVKAAALLIAEIERLDRAAIAAHEGRHE